MRVYTYVDICMYMYMCIRTRVCTRTAYCIWNVISSLSYLNWCSSCRCLLCYVPLERNHRDWEWRIRLHDTSNAIACTYICTSISFMNIHTYTYTCTYSYTHTHTHLHICTFIFFMHIHVRLSLSPPVTHTHRQSVSAPSRHDILAREYQQSIGGGWRGRGGRGGAFFSSPLKPIPEPIPLSNQMWL